MAIQTDEWNLKINSFLGMKTDRNSDDIPDGMSPNMRNCRVNGSAVFGAKGYNIAGNRTTAAGEIISQYTYNKGNGNQRMVRVRDNGSAGVLEWYDTVNVAWYTLLSGLTTGRIMGFTEFNTSTTDRMIFCNSAENVSTWTGNITRLTAAVTAGATTINVASTTGFPATGTIIYNGTEIAYTALTATTFTVANAHASAGANDGVAQAADDSTFSTVSKGNILLSAKDRLWIAGNTDAPNRLEFSDEGAPLTFTGGSNRADSGVEDVFDIGGRITGLSEKNDKIIILGPDGGVGFDFVYPTSTTKAPVYTQLFHSPGNGCVSAKSVFRVNDEVYYASRNGIKALADVVGTEKVGVKSITADILPTLADYVFTEAACFFYAKEDIVLIACRSDSDFSANDVVLGVDFFRTKDGQQTFGLTIFDWPVNDWCVLANDLYFGSSAEQNTMRAFDTNQFDGAPRTIRYFTKRYNAGNPFQEKGIKKTAVSGFIKEGSTIDITILFDGGFRAEYKMTIDSAGAYVSKNVLNTIGAFALGTNPIGRTLAEVSDLKRFLVYIDMPQATRFNDIQFGFESDSDGGTFEIDWIGGILEEEGHADRYDLTIGI